MKQQKAKWANVPWIAIFLVKAIQAKQNEIYEHFFSSEKKIMCTWNFDNCWFSSTAIVSERVTKCKKDIFPLKMEKIRFSRYEPGQLLSSIWLLPLSQINEFNFAEFYENTLRCQSCPFQKQIGKCKFQIVAYQFVRCQKHISVNAIAIAHELKLPNYRLIVPPHQNN